MSAQAFRIRRAGPADRELLASLIRESHRDVAERFGLTHENCPKHPSNCTAEWIDRDLSRGTVYSILEHEGVPAGCAAVEHASSEACYLERLSVLPAYRHKGFGEALVRDVIRQAMELGANEVGIGIIAGHEQLKRWYAGIGFIQGETREFPHLPFSVTFMRYPCGTKP
jgi:GNAT superfamily N-acetyltransferase